MLEEKNFLGLVSKVLNDLHVSRYVWEDYYDIGLIGLTKGLNKIKDDTTTTTFLYKCIKNEVLGQMRHNMCTHYSHKNDVSLTTPISDNLCLEDVLTDKKTNIEQELIINEDIKLLYNYVASLKERDKYILCFMYGLNGYTKLTKPEISKELNLPLTTVNYVVRTHLPIMRKLVIG